MAEEEVPTFRQRHLFFDGFADWRECTHLSRRVRHGRTGSRPARPCAATGSPTAAPAAAAATGRGVGRGIGRSVGRVRRAVAVAVAAAGTARRAGRSTARCAMTMYRCCASCHVANDTGYDRRPQALAQSFFAPRLGPVPHSRSFGLWVQRPNLP
jgi:hypothetical protein